MYGIKLSIPADKEYLKYIDETLLHFLSTFNVSQADRFHFALHECVINSIQACERQDDRADNRVYITISYYESRIQAWIRDSFGGAEDKDQILEKQSSNQGVLLENNRGILLIDHLVDEFTWETTKNGDFIVYIAMDFNKQKEL